MSGFQRSQRVSRQRPCGVCGKPDWCAITSDGRFALCQRLDSWQGKRAIRETAGGWLHALDERDWQPPPQPGSSQPGCQPLPRELLDRIYRRLTEECGLNEEARNDIVTKRRFPSALDGGALYFSLPRSGRHNSEVSEALQAEFGRDVIERVPGFSVACKSCDGAGVKDDLPCSSCGGLGKSEPRFWSARGGRHDYAVIACDEKGLAFWGMRRKLPFSEERDKDKYVLLSSSRAMEASLAGLPKYHVAGLAFVGRDPWLTEGIIKAEIAAAHLRHPVIGLAGTQPDAATIEAIRNVLRGWAA